MKDHVNEENDTPEYVSMLEEDYDEMVTDLECYGALVELLQDLLAEHGIDYSIDGDAISQKLRDMNEATLS